MSRFKLQKKTNLLYYNIFRFHRYTQYLVSSVMNDFFKMLGLGNVLERRSKMKNWDEYIIQVLNDPKGGVSLYFAGGHVTILVCLSLLTSLNVFCGLFRLPFDTVWFYGMFLAVILGVAISSYVAPIDRKNYLKDFRTFESWPKARKRTSGLITLLVILMIWSAFIGSSIYYLGSSPP